MGLTRVAAALLVGAVGCALGAEVRVEPHDGSQGSQVSSGLRTSSGSGGTGALRLTLLADQVAAWPDVAGSKFVRPPGFLQLLPLTVPTWQLEVGTEVTFTCPSSGAIEVCDAWVFIYGCARSCATKYQGGLPGLLAVSGWERTACGPQFVTGAPGTSYEHTMQGLRRQLARGTSATFTLPGAEAAEFVAFGIDVRGVDCSKWNGDAAGCGAAGDRCKWDQGKGQCVAADCRRRNVGPVPGCAECAWQGVVAPDRSPADGPFA